MTETIDHLYQSLDAFWALYIILFSTGYIISQVRTLGFKKIFAFLLPTGFILDPYRYQLENHPILIPCIMCFLLGLCISIFKEYGFMSMRFSLPNFSLPHFYIPKRKSKQAQESSGDHSDSFGYSESNNRADQERRQKEREERFRQSRGGSSRDQEEDQADTRTPLDVMGLKEGYSKEELKKRHRKLSDKYHPDKNQHMSEAVREEMEEELVKVNLAYEKLK